MKRQEKTRKSDAEHKPDIVIEGKALAFVIVVVICALLLCAVVFGLSAIVDRIISVLC